MEQIMLGESILFLTGVLAGYLTATRTCRETSKNTRRLQKQVQRDLDEYRDLIIEGRAMIARRENFMAKVRSKLGRN